MSEPPPKKRKQNPNDTGERFEKSKVQLDKKLGELKSGTIKRKRSREKQIESDSHPPGVVGTGQATPETTREKPIESDSHPLGVEGELDADDAPDYMTDRTAKPNTDTNSSDSRKIQEVEEEVHYPAVLFPE
ncbi:hypothetical protein CHS0354_016409 [Potamilus streckersoni]|uniref:Uncharacterized protein n=1 Tax=Potamilus streckersoni TaxID=2493646 RepID=A0AAE0W3I2_9BIVA|nr:hypothetical protein CHS0354_016409 [Potamilus streckersoni]